MPISRLTTAMSATAAPSAGKAQVWAKTRSSFSSRCADVCSRRADAAAPARRRGLVLDAPHLLLRRIHAPGRALTPSAQQTIGFFPLLAAELHRILLGEAPPALRRQQPIQPRRRLRMRAKQEVGVLQVFRAMH